MQATSHRAAVDRPRRPDPGSLSAGRRRFELRALLVLVILSIPASLCRGDFDATTRVDTNLIGMNLTNFGSFAHVLEPQGPGLTYPNGTDRTAVYAAGLWMGARVNGELRLSAADYSMTYGPGVIVSPGQWADPEDDRYRTYKIEPGDTDESNPDYAEWPVEDGAPVDEYGSPRILGDQMLWSVFNDLNPALRTNIVATQAPLGIEVRHTTFAAYRSGPLERTVFLEWKILNRGLDPLTDAYVSIWADPDLGGSSDDFGGCDTLLSLGYCYNSVNDDEVYRPTPPAVGIRVIQGPVVPSPGDTAYVSGELLPGYRNLPMTSFAKFINGTDPVSPTEGYNYMQGLNRDGSVVIDPTTGLPTRYWLPGDPVNGIGWIDGSASDCRMFVSCGPFTMAPGDTQTIAVAVIVGHGADRLASVTALKQEAAEAPGLFRELVETPPPQPPRLLWTWEPDPRWLTGVDAGLETFFGGIGFGYQFFGSTLGDDDYVPVRIRFDSSETTTCARYDRNLGYAWVGTGTFRGSAYDISDPLNPRRLNICFSEYSDLDGVWEPDSSSIGAREYLFIMNSNYNGGVDYNDENWGPGADVQYAAWLRVRDPYAFFQTDPAVLTLYFPVPLAVDDGAPFASGPAGLTDVRAFPNPVRDRMSVDFALARSVPVTLSILDVSGRIVERTIPAVVYGAGSHRVEWSRSVGSRGLASGIYFLRLQAGQDVVCRRLVMLR